MARIFLAIPLPGRVKSRLAEEVDRLRLAGAKVTWVPKENLHVTLWFFGDQDDDAILTLDPIVGDVLAEFGPLPLQACGLGAFPDLERPRVIWCGIVGQDREATATLQELRRKLDGELRAAGFRREKGEFHPHVTLGRVRGPLNTKSLAERMGPSVRRPFGVFELNEVILYESRQGAEGSEYTPLKTYGLGR